MPRAAAAKKKPAKARPRRNERPTRSAQLRRRLLRDALARARALVPALRERAAGAEKARTLRGERSADCTRADPPLDAPKRWGGMEFDFVAYVDFCYELARGCPSTAWNFGNLQVHTGCLRCTRSARRRKYGRESRGADRLRHRLSAGRGKKVEGGYVIAESGISRAAQHRRMEHARGHGREATGPSITACAAAKSQYEVIDDWQVLGMRATGSMTVVAKDVFVPEYKALGC